MAEEFKAITTQEEFDAAIKSRLTRAEAAAVKKYEGWISPEDHAKALDDLKKAHAEELGKYSGLQAQIDTLTKENGELKISGWKQTALSRAKLPAEYLEFIQGNDEKAINESADKLAKLAGENGKTGITKNTDAASGNGGAWSSVLQSIKSQ